MERGVLLFILSVFLFWDVALSSFVQLSIFLSVILPMSSSSLSQHRLLVNVIIEADTLGLKTYLIKFFTEANLGAIIGPRTIPHQTPLQFEGPSTLVNRTLVVLKEQFNFQFPGVDCNWSEPQIATEEQRLESVRILETPAELKRSISSGDFKEILLEDISFGYKIYISVY